MSENFEYAMELVQCCHKHKAPTLVLKEDFAKALDSVDWGSLALIMQAMGFPSKWVPWSCWMQGGFPSKWVPSSQQPSCHHAGSVLY
jgi:hypothetical protein